MKKLILAVLMTVLACGAFAKQPSVKTAMFDYLSQEGYVPSYDEDDDITFKSEGDRFYIEYTQESEFWYVEISTYYDTAGFDAETVLNAANAVNASYKVVKAAIISDERLCVSAACFVNDGKSLVAQFDRMFQTVKAGAEAFINELSDDDESSDEFLLEELLYLL